MGKFHHCQTGETESKWYTHIAVIMGELTIQANLRRVILLRPSLIWDLYCWAAFARFLSAATSLVLHSTFHFDLDVLFAVWQEGKDYDQYNYIFLGLLMLLPFWLNKALLEAKPLWRGHFNDLLRVNFQQVRNRTPHTSHLKHWKMCKTVSFEFKSRLRYFPYLPSSIRSHLIRLTLMVDFIIFRVTLPILCKFFHFLIQ